MLVTSSIHKVLLLFILASMVGVIFHIFSFRNLKRMTDEALVQTYKETQDMNYVAEFYSRKSAMISAICVKYMDRVEDAEDAACELFEVLSRDLLKHEVSNINGWLFMVCRNYCYKKLNKEKRALDGLAMDERVISQHGIDTVDDELEEKNLQEIEFELLEKAILQLKDDQRVCIEMFYIKQLSYKEIELETGLDLKKVKSHIQNGKRNLRIWIEEQVEK